MTEEVKIGFCFLVIGVLFIYFSFKEIKKFRKEKYDPFKDKSRGIKRLLNVEVYYKSYFIFIFGVLSILLSIIFVFFLNY